MPELWLVPDSKADKSGASQIRFCPGGVLEHIIIIALRFLQADLAISRGWPLGRRSPSPEAAGAFRLSEDNSAPGR